MVPLFNMNILVVLWVWTLIDQYEACQCGVVQLNAHNSRKSPGYFKIIDGHSVKRGQYPWMASLLPSNYRSVNSFLLCGAVLISKRYALTAYHCTQGVEASKYSLLLGAHNIDNPENGSQLVGINNFIKYKPGRRHKDADDIALLHLKKDAELGTYIQPICLPRSDFAGTSATVMGYGDTKRGPKDEGAGETSVPLAAEVGVVGTKRCNKVIKNYSHGDQISMNTLCGGSYGGQPDHCFGDSGGPLMHYSSQLKVWVLIGIVQGGYKCGDPKTYSFYTNVSYYYEWIQSNSGYAGCHKN